MPQRISDDDLDGLVEHSEHQLKIAELGKPSLYCFTDDLVLDLRDARQQLKIAVEALENAKETLQTIAEDWAGNGHLSKRWRDIDTALDRIKGIADANK